MDTEAKFAYWLHYAQYDLETAEAMLNTKRWLYVVFMCQQATEKLAKGLYGLYLGFDTIPRIHNIKTIIRRFENNLPTPIDAELYNFFDTLTAHYIDNRYPDYIADLTQKINETRAKQIYAKTKEVFLWLSTLKT
jgi:HEPN domain-containing protein